jgi:L-2-hydroxyglutarate oxidase LhgO
MGLQMLSHEEVKKLEPNVEAVAGLLSLSTGVVDSYNLMRCFYGLAKENGAEFVFNTEIIGIDKKSGGYEVKIQDREGISSITAAVVINSAGLNSDKVAQLAGIDIKKAGYKIRYCKGEYFRLNSKVGRLVSRLVYPVPEQAGIGVHITLSLDGAMRLGPSVKYVDAIDYSVDERNQSDFYKAAHRYLPIIEMDDLSPDFAGIRPKLQGPGEKFRDFVVTDESEKGLPGIINLIGIESPGLTASPAIAQHVAEMVREILK